MYHLFKIKMVFKMTQAELFHKAIDWYDKFDE